MATILDTCAGAPSEDFAPGDVLLAEGDTTGRLYILAGGAVEVLRGDTQVAVVGDPGAVFGEMPVLHKRRARLNLISHFLSVLPYEVSPRKKVSFRPATRDAPMTTRRDCHAALDT